MEVALIKLGYDVLKDSYKYSSRFVSAPIEDGDAVPQHVSQIESWSAAVSLFGMPKPLLTDASTIEISLSDKPRRFYGRQGRPISERAVLTSGNSSIILGDPGAGKTTFAKRLVRYVVTEAPGDDQDTTAFPILVFGRELGPKNSLFGDLFKKLGFHVKPQFIGERVSKEDADEWSEYGYDAVFKAIRAGLRNAKVLILIDGIDEIDPAERSLFENELIKLREILCAGRIVATCRTGDWSRATDFDIYELVPLSADDINSIIKLWAEDAHAFNEEITKVPYSDLLDRPLFLTMLIMIFNQTGSLPDQPAEVYHRVISQLIEKWDTGRGFSRTSKYSGFGTERKLKFLSAIAYVMLVTRSLRRFSLRDLNHAYAAVHSQFNLPLFDAEKVVREIESHTGIVVESGFETYEFSHLTIHEFLAAFYLVGMSDFRGAVSAMSMTAATVAVATCLSSTPARFMGQVLLRYIETPLSHDITKSRIQFLAVDSYLTRLRLERPALVVDKAFGAAVLKIIILYLTIKSTIKDDSYTELSEDNLNFILEHYVTRDSVNDILAISRTTASTETDVTVSFDIRLIEDVPYSRDLALKFSNEMLDVLNSKRIYISRSVR